jgi:hypothetical protein
MRGRAPLPWIRASARMSSSARWRASLCPRRWPTPRRPVVAVTYSRRLPRARQLWRHWSRRQSTCSGLSTTSYTCYAQAGGPIQRRWDRTQSRATHSAHAFTASRTRGVSSTQSGWPSTSIPSATVFVCILSRSSNLKLISFERFCAGGEVTLLVTGVNWEQVYLLPGSHDRAEDGRAGLGGGSEARRVHKLRPATQ